MEVGNKEIDLKVNFNINVPNKVRNSGGFSVERMK